MKKIETTAVYTSAEIGGADTQQTSVFHGALSEECVIWDAENHFSGYESRYNDEYELEEVNRCSACGAFLCAHDGDNY